MSQHPSLLSLEGISKKYAGFALQNISFELEEGDYFMLLGVSGAGKSMILETIAGLLAPDNGKLIFRGMDITRQKIQDRKIGIVFQDHAVFPHMSVFDNIAFPVRRKMRDKALRQQLVKEQAQKLGIEHLLSRRPSTLSGGELQRVALARTLMQKPEILLLDEPLASLDISLRAGLRSLLRKLNREGQTIIHVTHDYEEALSLGNRIAVINAGQLLQTGTPEDVFNHPRSEFVAHFTGARNFFRAEFSADSGEALISPGISIKTAASEVPGSGFILIRSEDIFLSLDEVATTAINNFEAVIEECVPIPSGFEIRLNMGIIIYAGITRESQNKMRFEPGMKCRLHFKASAVRIIGDKN
jgi:ABC-type Fe3+/spermidine/putrescine transport system ATPase subunit